jgi:hypothetical protein
MTIDMFDGNFDVPFVVVRVVITLETAEFRSLHEPL